MILRKPLFPLVAVALCLASLTAEAQVFSGGTFNSFKGYGLAADIPASDGNFRSVNLWADYRDLIGGETDGIGIKASFIHNFLIYNTLLPNGVGLEIYSGPGIAIGYVGDRKSGRGAMGAFSADVGVRLRFSRPVVISIGVTADLGLHAGKPEDEPKKPDGSGAKTVLSMYENGIRHAWFPEVRVMYNFSGGRSGADSGPKRRRLTFAAEWGVTVTPYSNWHYNYVTSIGNRVDVKGSDTGLGVNYYIDAAIGYDLLPRLNLSVHGSRAGIADGMIGWPVGLRGTVSFGKLLRHSALAYAEGGVIFFDDLPEGRMVRAGGGIRIPIHKTVSLDILLGARLAVAHPEYYDEHIRGNVPHDLLRARDAAYLGFSFGTALNF